MRALKKIYSAIFYLSFTLAVMSTLCKVFYSVFDVYQMQNNQFVLLFITIVLFSVAMTVLLRCLWIHVSRRLK